MTDLIIPGLVAAAALTFTYLFCIRPMRNGGHCGMPGISQTKSCCDTDADAEVQRLRAEVAGLRRDLSIDESASNTSAADSNPTVKQSH